LSGTPMHCVETTLNLPSNGFPFSPSRLLGALVVTVILRRLINCRIIIIIIIFLNPRKNEGGKKIKKSIIIIITMSHERSGSCGFC